MFGMKNVPRLKKQISLGKINIKHSLADIPYRFNLANVLQAVEIVAEKDVEISRRGASRPSNDYSD